MIRNYFKIAWRNLVRNRQFNFLSLAGLIVAVAGFSLLFVVVNFEGSFDSFHKDSDRIYRVISLQTSGEGEQSRTPGSPLPVAAQLALDLPQIQVMAPVFGTQDPTVAVLGTDTSSAVQKKFKEEDQGLFVTPAFFSLFNFSWIAGSSQVLSDPYTVVLSRSYAEKYFGSPELAMGRILKIDNKINFEVKGILEDPPLNTDLPVNLVFSYATKKAHPLDFGYANFDNWNNTSSNDQLFVKLGNDVTEAEVNKQLAVFSEKHYHKTGTGGSVVNLLSPLADMHSDSELDKFSRHFASAKRMDTLRLIGSIILLMACINFINIATALSTRRAKEVGIRKTLGGRKGQLIAQFLVETFLLVFLATLAGVLIAWALLPYSNQLFQLPAGVSLFSRDFVLMMLLLPLIVTLIAGLYPSLVLSSFSPIKNFREYMPGSWQQVFSLRKTLIVVQFSVALVLIVATVINLQQLSHLKNMDLGFDKEGVYRFDMDLSLADRNEHFRNEVLASSEFQNISFSMDAPSSEDAWTTNFFFDHRETGEGFECYLKSADSHFFDTYGMQLLAGRIYEESDSVRGWVVNETMAHRLGYDQPAAIVGKDIRLGSTWIPVIAVVKDFQSASARDKTRPILFTQMPDMYFSGAVKIKTSNLTAAVDHLNSIYNQIYPEAVPNGKFYEKDLEEYYTNERTLGQLSWIFSLLSIFIACLGLFGLAAFNTEQRTKEIGIRKVLGASASGIAMLLSRDFLKLVAISILIATPVSLYIMSQWLRQFEYRVSIHWWVFALAGLLALLIAFATLSLQTLKAALRSPVKSLRSE